ncbi:MAG: glutamyl-tRNA(Gln) amidotransferase subunit A [Patescibacteria group bacterium]|nr:MAG: glutamyl-tRNA(Gln) amidotransferase subunit A [Patescibacteria group bacterium]
MEIPLTIKETQEALRKGEISCVGLVDYYLERINKFDKEINAVLTVSSEVAYRKARENDKLIDQLGDRAFEEFPLLGVSVIHKDMFLTKGIRTTAASKVLEDYVPVYSATVVERLEKAGCITLGKANQDAWAHGSSGENSDFGPTKNPWNEKLVPGGSSSGSAASLAADFCLVSTGTDTCGSIRLPANYCGVLGLKPTYGSVSRYGVIAMASSLDSIGHFGRTVDDVRRVFEITKGIDGRDSTLASLHKKFIGKEHLKIGLPKEFLGEGLEDEIKNEVLHTAKILKEMGHEVVEISLPHTKYGIDVYYIIQPAEVSSNLARYDGVRYGKDRIFFGDEAKRRIMLGSYVLSAGYYDAYYLKAMKVRSIIIKEVEEAFEKVDVIIAPVSPTLPFKLGEKINDPLKMYLTDIYAATANLTGIPSLAVPSGFNKKGLPLGFQIMGPKFSENLLFDLAEKYHNFTDYSPKVVNLR